MGRPKIAFVASGGAGKGIAHLGALRAIEELALDVDIFVGSSVGAIVSAFWAQGVSADDMVDWFRMPIGRRRDHVPLRARHFLGAPNGEQLRKPGYLASGMLSIDRFESFLHKELPIDRFDELDRKLLVTATEVDGRGRTVFGSGHRSEVPISKAIAASCCVPLLYRPHRVGDRYYLDGELVRTLSIDLAVEAGADVIIISNVYRPHVQRPGDASVAHGGASGVMRQAINIVLSEKEKRGIDLIHRLYPHVHVLNVSADVGSYPFLGQRRARRMLTRGYREALRVLAAAKRRSVFDVASNVHTVGQA